MTSLSGTPPSIHRSKRPEPGGHLYPRPVQDPVLIHADPRFVIIDKPPGMLSVPGKGPDKADCAISRVRSMFPHATGPMVVHRLDMDTSGLLLIALNPDSQRELCRQFEHRLTSKRYIALLEGSVMHDAGEITVPLRPNIDNRPHQIADFVHRREAVTRNRVTLAREAGDLGGASSPARSIAPASSSNPSPGAATNSASTRPSPASSSAPAPGAWAAPSSATSSTAPPPNA